MKINLRSPDEWLDVFDDRGNVSFLRCRRFAHAPGSRSDERFMRNHLVIFVETGDLTAFIDDDVIHCSEGDALWVPPGVVRRTVANPSSGTERDYRLHFNVGSPGAATCFSIGPMLKSDCWETLPFFQALAAEPENERGASTHYLHGVLLALSAKFINHVAPTNENVFSSKERKNIMTYIADNPRKRVTPADLAVHLRLTPDYFSRKFRRSFGTSPRAFLVAERVRQSAHALMESAMSVKEVADQHGYEDVNLFCRQFKRVMGVSPGRYRKRDGTSFAR